MPSCAYPSEQIGSETFEKIKINKSANATQEIFFDDVGQIGKYVESSTAPEKQILIK